MQKCLSTLTMAAIICGLGVQNMFADDLKVASVAEQKRGNNNREFEVAIKRMTAHLKELTKEAAELKKANKLDRFDLTQKKIKETIEKLEALKSRYRKSQDKPKPKRKVRRRKEVRRSKERRERDRGNQSEINNAIEKATAKHHALELQAEKFADSNNNDALERVKAQLRESGGYLERLHGMRNRQREGQGNRREQANRRERDERQKEHPEIRGAVNRLEHMRAAIGHLKEAGLTELAQVTGERAEKLEAVIDRSRRAMDERREEEEREEERHHETDGEMRELGQAVRQLSQQLKELRKDVSSLKKKLGNR